MQNTKVELSSRSYTASTPPLFHLVYAVSDIEATRAFYVDKPSCKVGRSAERWIAFDFFGHQVSAQRVDDAMSPAETNQIEGEKVPSRHFGAILDWDDWHAMKDRLKADGADFIIAPTTRFASKVGKKATMFFRDPPGNALELKHYATNQKNLRIKNRPQNKPAVM